jgi:hypothetical protein
MNAQGRDHPFYFNTYNGRDLYTISADDRLCRIKSMNQEELRKVLKLPDLQRSVRRAAERRLLRLDRHEHR